ncbi:MAG: hypothetical protein JNM22_15935 [Saprospiraceae bacterium]|nr:hypothetical protein [Saprospiraceae bacterium]
MHTPKTIEDLVIESKLEEALEALIEIFRAKNVNHKDAAILCFSQLRDLKHREMSGVIDTGGTEINKIRKSILDLSRLAFHEEPSLNDSNKETDRLNLVLGKLRLVFFDDFRPSPLIDLNDPLDLKKWNTGNVTVDGFVSGRIKKVNNRMIIQNYQDIRIVSEKKISINEHRDYLVVLKTNSLGFAGNYWYGISWGRNDWNNMYYFIINERAKHALIGYFFEGQEKTLFSMPISSIANENHFWILKTHDFMRFYINKVEIFKSSVLSFFGDKVALYTMGQGKISFDRIEIYGQ